MKKNLFRLLSSLSLALLVVAPWPVIAEETAALTNPPPESTVSNAPPAGEAPPAKSPGHRRETMVLFGEKAELGTNDIAEVLVVIGGSANVQGKVLGPVVVVGGDISVDGTVEQETVAVLGNIELGPKAKVSGDVVAVGGKVKAAEGSRIKGHVQEIGFGWFSNFLSGLRQWLVECVIKMRPLAPGIAWLWAVTGVVFLVYLVIAAVFRCPVRACVEEVRQRPASSFLIGMLSLILYPLVLTLLGFTLVGLIVVPFLFAALVVGVIVGKIAIYEWIGQSLCSRFRAGKEAPWLVAFALGFALIVGFYLVPFLGMVVFTVLTVWALGVATIAVFSGFRQELPEKAPPMPPPPYPPMPMMGSVPGTTAYGPGGYYGAPPVTGHEPPPPPSPGGFGPVPPPLGLPEGLSFPRAGFWERMGAAFLDVILIGIVAHLVKGPPFAFLVALAYFAGMWAWKGTTIGGIVLGLKVVRMDNRPVNLLVGIVRGLAAAFSALVLFLGFLWIIWDRDKQGWHDKIAGTVVIKMPRGTSLVCI